LSSATTVMAATSSVVSAARAGAGAGMKARSATALTYPMIGKSAMIFSNAWKIRPAV